MARDDGSRRPRVRRAPVRGARCRARSCSRAYRSTGTRGWKGIRMPTIGHAIVTRSPTPLLGSSRAPRPRLLRSPRGDPTYRGRRRRWRCSPIVVVRARAAGWTVGNVDAVVNAEAPPLAGHLAAMVENLTEVLGGFRVGHAEARRGSRRGRGERRGDRRGRSRRSTRDPPGLIMGMVRRRGSRRCSRWIPRRADRRRCRSSRGGCTR